MANENEWRMTVILTKEDKFKLRAMALEKDCTISDIVKKALSEYFEDKITNVKFPPVSPPP